MSYLCIDIMKLSKIAVDGVLKDTETIVNLSICNIFAKQSLYFHVFLKSFFVCITKSSMY